MDSLGCYVNGGPSLWRSGRHKGQAGARTSKYGSSLAQLPPTDLLCRPCPWDWMFFLENCYFSMSKQNWSDSVTACQDVGAQLVIIESNKEKVYLLKSPSYSEA